jgi:hypothetical protein
MTRLILQLAAGVALAGSLATAPACTRQTTSSTGPTHDAAAAAPAAPGGSMMSEADARRIAAEDAVTRYPKLDVYDVSARLENGAWHIDYTPRAGADGGGPVYVIDAKSGQIVSKKYYQ